MPNVSSSIQTGSRNDAGGTVRLTSGGGGKFLYIYTDVTTNSTANNSVASEYAVFNPSAAYPEIYRWYVRFDAKSIPAATSIDYVTLTVDQELPGPRGAAAGQSKLELTSSFVVCSASLGGESAGDGTGAGVINSTTMQGDYNTNWLGPTGEPGRGVIPLTGKCTLTGTGPHTFPLNTASHGLLCDQEYLDVAFIEFFYDWQVITSGTVNWDRIHVAPAAGPCSSAYGDFSASFIPPGNLGQPKLSIIYWKDGIRATTTALADPDFVLNNYSAQNQDRKSMVPAPFGINRKGVPNLRTSPGSPSPNPPPPYKTTKG